MWGLLFVGIGCAPDGPLPARLSLPDLEVDGVVVLEIDTLRADHLPMYGYVRDTMPRTGAWPWWVIDGHRSPASWTLPSVTSLLTSLEPANHGLVSSEEDLPSLLVAPTWPAELGSQGWATGLFTGNNYVGQWSGLDGAFQVSVLDASRDPGSTNLDHLADAALAWLDTLPPGQPYMVHLQPMDAHSPLEPAPEDLAQLRSDPLPFSGVEGRYSTGLFRQAWAEAADDAARREVRDGAIDVYDASLLGLDRSVDRLLQALAERGGDVLVVLSADHGESLDDPGDGTFGHGHRWREELSRVPLMMLAPGLDAGRVECQSLNVDVWPTLSGAMGLGGLTRVDGQDLRERCRDHTRGSYWEQGRTLSYVGVATAEAALGHDCRSGRQTGTRVGAGADPTQLTPASRLPDGEALTEILGEARAEILERWPDDPCAP